MGSKDEIDGDRDLYVLEVSLNENPGLPMFFARDLLVSQAPIKEVGQRLSERR